MGSNRGYANRERHSGHLRAIRAAGMEITSMKTKMGTLDSVAVVRPHLAAPFRGLTDDDLRTSEAWIVARKT